VPDGEIQLRQEFPQEWEVDALPLHERTQINQETRSSTRSPLSAVNSMQEPSDSDCPQCKASKYVHDAYYVADQDVWHYRCLNCDKEWVE